MRDGPVLRMVYNCFDPQRKRGAICGATSTDGLRWTDLPTSDSLPGRLIRTRPGEWDESAWAHYADEVTQLRAAGVEPMLTLLHFTLPTWLADRGGLAADDFAQRFGAFAAEAARRLGYDVRYWCTINEPNVQMYQSYVVGVWPPESQDREQAARAFTGLVRAHALA